MRPRTPHHIVRSAVLLATVLAMTATAVFISQPIADAYTAQCDGKPITIDMNTNGGNGAGTSGNDVILGTPGNDTITSYGGDDTICAGGGNDAIYGAGGHDRIWGQGGKDRIFGGDGNDLISGVAGNDQIRGGAGDDTIYGGAGDDTIWAQDGHDAVWGSTGNDTIYGENGDDELTGGGGTDIINGGPGIDTCDAESETNCETIQPPQWVHGAEIVVEQISFDKFTVSWGPLVGGLASPESLTLTVSDSNRNLHTWPIDPDFDYLVVVDNFLGDPLNPNEIYGLTLFAENPAGTSPTLTGTAELLYIEWAATITVSDLDGSDSVVYHSPLDAQGSEPLPWNGETWIEGSLGSYIGDGCIRFATVWSAELTTPRLAAIEIGAHSTVDEVCAQNGTISSWELVTYSCSAAGDFKTIPTIDAPSVGHPRAIVTNYCRFRLSGKSEFGLTAALRLVGINIKDTTEWDIDLVALAKRTYDAVDVCNGVSCIDVPLPTAEISAYEPIS